METLQGKTAMRKPAATSTTFPLFATLKDSAFEVALFCGLIFPNSGEVF